MFGTIRRNKMNELYLYNFYIPMGLAIGCLTWLTVKFSIQEFKRKLNKYSELEVHGNY